MSILLTGGSGRLGTELTKILAYCNSPSRTQLDITNKEQVSSFFQNNDIDLIIHAAALTNIRFCEENRKLTWETNVQGTKNLVEATLNSKNRIKYGSLIIIILIQ